MPPLRERHSFQTGWYFLVSILLLLSSLLLLSYHDLTTLSKARLFVGVIFLTIGSTLLAGLLLSFVILQIFSSQMNPDATTEAIAIKFINWSVVEIRGAAAGVLVSFLFIGLLVASFLYFNKQFDPDRKRIDTRRVVNESFINFIQCQISSCGEGSDAEFSVWETGEPIGDPETTWSHIQSASCKFDTGAIKQTINIRFNDPSTSLNIKCCLDDTVGFKQENGENWQIKNTGGNLYQLISKKQHDLSFTIVHQ